MQAKFKLSTIYRVRCERDGKTVWERTIENMVVLGGGQDFIETYGRGVNYTAAWQIGLKDGGIPFPTDTLLSHPSWNELTPYTGLRPVAQVGTATFAANVPPAPPGVTAYIDNAAHPLVYNITAPATIGGCFSCTPTVLYGVATGALGNVVPGDTLYVVVIFTATEIGGPS
jgi:hypothetical protein